MTIRDTTIERDHFPDIVPVPPKPPPDVPYLVPRPKIVMEGTCLLDQIVDGRVRKLLVVDDRGGGVQAGPLRLVPDCTSNKMPYTVVDVQVMRVASMRIADAPASLLTELDCDTAALDQVSATVLEFVRNWIAGDATAETQVQVCDIEFERAYHSRFLEDGDPAINPEYVSAMAEYEEWLNTSPECEDYRKAKADSPLLKAYGEAFRMNNTDHTGDSPADRLRRLDAEVAVCLFGFEWWASREQTDRNDRLCVLHASDELVARGWQRTNWAPEFYERLPAGTVWPGPGCRPFVGWDRGAWFCPEGCEYKTHLHWYGIPYYSSDWRWAGQVLEWLGQRGTVEFCAGRAGRLDVRIDSAAVVAGTSGETLCEAFCRLALLVWRQSRPPEPDQKGPPA